MKKILLVIFSLSLLLCLTSCFHEHEMGEWIFYPPTCTEDGIRYRVCECGLKDSEIIPADGHCETALPAVAPGCTEDGLTEGKICYVCNTVTLAQQTIPAIGHDTYSYSEKGEECHIIDVIACQRCDYADRVDSMKVNHSFGEWENVIPDFEVCECEYEAIYISRCLDCDYVESKIESAPGHLGDHIRIEVMIAPTEGSSGTLYTTCLNCTCHNFYYEIPHLNSLDYTVTTKYATCTDDGVRVYILTLYGNTYSWEVAIPPRGHNYVDNVCINCNDTIMEEVLEAGLYDESGNLLASWDELVNTYGMNVQIDYEALDYNSTPSHPTYVLSNGALASGCKLVIGNDVTKIGSLAFFFCKTITSIVLPESVSNISEGAFMEIPSLTSLSISAKNGYYKTIDGNIYSKDGKTLVIYMGKTTNELIIPDGVTTIGSNAFYGHSELQSITLPEGVTTISSYAFMACSGLASINLPESLRSIGECAFMSCTSLTSIVIPYGIESIPDSCFIMCTSLSDVTIPSSVTSIGDSAFWYCKALTSITIPNSVTSIRAAAFAQCSALESIIIPDSVTSLGGSVFGSCTSLTTATLPKGLTAIESGMFNGCTSLSSVNIPETVTYIYSAAFSNCTSLTSIFIPGGVTVIESWAFNNCYQITNVYYGNTESEWEKIEIDSLNEVLTSATIHYNYVVE